MITEEKILFFINNHYSEAITLETVADSLGFSKYYVSRQFKSCTHCNFCDYLNKVRSKAAAEMLRSSDFSITEIAMRAGFQSIASFNRTFKSIFGCSPTKYRSQYASGPLTPAMT
jgi:AraC-like DNA-binding protein